jgi:hypothetical protein
MVNQFDFHTTIICFEFRESFTANLTANKKRLLTFVCNRLIIKLPLLDLNQRPSD